MKHSNQLPAEGYSKEHRRKARWRKVVTTLAAVVVFCTTYALILPAITWDRTLVCELKEHTHTDSCYEMIVVSQATNELVCGLEEHTHDEDCYDKKLVCGLEESEGHQHGDECYNEDGELICGMEESEGHTHTDACYETVLICAEQEHTHSDKCYTVTEEKTEKVLTCKLPEHKHAAACFDAPPAEEEGYYCGKVSHHHSKEQGCYFEDGSLKCTLDEHEHTLACKSNPNADLETEEIWRDSFSDVKKSGNWAKDVLAIADSQLGYTESTRNYIVEDHDTMKGYTRYGDWYGVPYGDWCAMFCSFCIDYAGVKDYPQDCNCENWITTLSSVNEKSNEPGYYHPADSYTPQPGDLIFFDWDAEEEKADAAEDDEKVAAQENAKAVALTAREQAKAEKDAIKHAVDTVDHVGFVYEIIEATKDTPAQIKTIEGNNGDAVAYHTYDLDSVKILGYGELPENPALVKDEAEQKNDPETAKIKTDAALEMENTTIHSKAAADGAVAEISGRLPVGAEAYIKAVRLSEKDLVSYFGTDRAEAMKSYVAYDITIMVNGTEWEPDKSVSVVVKQPDITLNSGDMLGVGHVIDDGKPAADVDATINKKGTQVSFETDGFSVYVLYTYTVDFHYGEYDLSVEGESSIMLSKLFGSMGIDRSAKDVRSVTFSDPSLVAVEKMRIGDWLLTSLEPFDTEETLTVEFENGDVYIITVTDAQTAGNTYWQRVTTIDDPDAYYMLVTTGTNGRAFGIKDGEVIAGTPNMTAVTNMDGYYTTTIGTDYWWLISGTTDTTSKTWMNASFNSYSIAFVNSRNLGTVVHTGDYGMSPKLTYSDGSWQVSHASNGTTYYLRYNNNSFSWNTAATNYYIYKQVDTLPGTVRSGNTYAVPVYSVKVDKNGNPISEPVLRGVQQFGNTAVTPSNLFTSYGLPGTYQGAYYGTGDDAVYGVTSLQRSSNILNITHADGTRQVSATTPDALYLTYTSPQSGGSTQEVGIEMEINKQIDYLGDGVANPDTDVSGDTWYRLYLDAQFQTNPAIDLVFVVDLSGSMANNGGATAVRNFLNGTNGEPGFLESFHEACPDNQYSIVSFWGNTSAEVINARYNSGTNADSSLDRDWTKNTSSITFNHSAGGGTDYNAGIFRAEDQFDKIDKNNGHKKVLIYLSDGEPTNATKSKTENVRYGTGASLNEDGAAATIAAIDAFHQNYCQPSNYDVETYCIAFGREDEIFNREYLNRLADYDPEGNGTQSKVFLASDSDEIKQVFTTALYPKNASINDNLSIYAQWGQGKADAKVTMTPRAGGNTIVLYENGAVTTAGKGILKDVVYTRGDTADETTGQVQAVFEEDYALDPAYRYTLSFNVQNTAYAFYDAEKYGSVRGDSDSDFGGNTTSSVKPGFHSNRDAHIDYTVGDEPDTDIYEHPVVQALNAPEDTREKRTMIIEKVWADGADIHEGDEVRVTLYQDDVVYDTAVLNKANDWKKVYNDLPIETETGEPIEYSVEEARVRGYRTEYSEEDIHESGISDVTWEETDHLESGKTYLLVTSAGAIGHDSGNEYELITKTAAETDTKAQWKALAIDGGYLLTTGDGYTFEEYTSRYGEYYRLSDSGLLEAMNYDSTTKRLGSTYESENSATYYLALRNGNRLTTSGYLYARASNGSPAPAEFTLYEKVEHTAGMPAGDYRIFTVTNTVDDRVVDCEIWKTDMSGRLIHTDIAEFELYADEGLTDYIDTYTTVDGVLKIEGIVPGTYYLRETKAPNGFILAPHVVSFSVDENGNCTCNPNEIYLESQDGVLLFHNSSGEKLPETGGIGRIAIYISGAAVLTATLIFGLVIWRKKGKGGK
ncbi:MAG: Cna B-type domain-containing protein [Clostridiales bacterium]|nr:Cna B-type domain-containing protein [Candidatus Cacconaster stercorequi]